MTPGKTVFLYDGLQSNLLVTVVISSKYAWLTSVPAKLLGAQIGTPQILGGQCLKTMRALAKKEFCSLD